VTRRSAILSEPRTCRRPSVIIIADKIQVYPKNSISGHAIITVPTVRTCTALEPAIKSLNYLNNILPKSKQTTAAARGVMLNSEGFVSESRPTIFHH